MGPIDFICRCSAPIAIWYFCCALEITTASAQVPSSAISIVYLSGTVEISPAGQAAWSAASIGQTLKPGDRVRTRAHSQLTLRLSTNDTVRFHDISEFQIQRPAGEKKKSTVSLLQGMLYLFHRGKAADYDFNTPTASAAIRGTEFNLEAQANGRTIVTMLEGVVELSNAQGPITVYSHEQGIAEPGKPPTKSPML